jgi:hypothetical protein
VHSADKVGRDAGEHTRIGAIGVVATNDAEQLIALRRVEYPQMLRRQEGC